MVVTPTGDTMKPAETAARVRSSTPDCTSSTPSSVALSTHIVTAPSMASYTSDSLIRSTTSSATTQPTNLTQAHDNAALAPEGLQGVQIAILAIALVLLVFAASFFVPRWIMRRKTTHNKPMISAPSPSQSYLEPDPFMFDVESQPATFAASKTMELDRDKTPFMTQHRLDKPLLTKSDSSASNCKRALSPVMERSSGSSGYTVATAGSEYSDERITPRTRTISQAHTGAASKLRKSVPIPPPIKVPPPRQGAALPLAIQSPSDTRVNVQTVHLPRSPSPFASSADSDDSPSPSATSTAASRLRSLMHSESQSPLLAQPSASLDTPPFSSRSISSSISASPSPMTPIDSTEVSPASSASRYTYAHVPRTQSPTPPSPTPNHKDVLPHRNFAHPYTGPGTPMSEEWDGRKSLGFIAIPIEEALKLKARFKNSFASGALAKSAGRAEPKKEVTDAGLTRALQEYRLGRTGLAGVNGDYGHARQRSMSS